MGKITEDLLGETMIFTDDWRYAELAVHDLNGRFQSEWAGYGIFYNGVAWPDERILSKYIICRYSIYDILIDIYGEI